MPLDPSDDDRAQAEIAFRNLMILREGKINHVYADSRGLPTVGIGHLVTADDELAMGAEISDARVDELFHQDATKALNAAWSQADEAGITSLPFIPSLASVNFQLGTDWTGKFPDTWKMIENGQYIEAAHALEGTLWHKQTPVRVADFQHALLVLPPKVA